MDVFRLCNRAHQLVEEVEEAVGEVVNMVEERPRAHPHRADVLITATTAAVVL